ncbi:MAG: hypothetical protein GY816_06775 [Cytophagales bacterium]|nr:hypothetical protein [Cytophagales bacterium]
MNKSLTLVSLLCLLVSLTNCKDDDSLNKIKLSNSFDISDAVALAIVDQPDNARLDGGKGGNLFKVTVDGEYVELQLLDEDGNIIDDEEFISELFRESEHDGIHLEQIIDIHPDYLLLLGDFIPISWVYHNDGELEVESAHKLLLNKTSGKLYDLSASSFPYFHSGDNDNPYDFIKRDQQSRVYYGTHSSHGYWRMDVSDPDAIVEESYLPDYQIQDYRTVEVDADGNLYYLSYSDNLQSYQLKARKESGGIATSNVIGQMWTDGDLNVYMRIQNHDPLLNVSINKLSIMNGEIVLDEIWYSEDSDEISVLLNNEGYYNDSPLVVNGENNSLFIGENSYSYSYLNNQIEVLDLSITGILIQKTKSFAYFYDESNGNNTISRLDLVDLSVTEILLPYSDYDIYRWFVTTNDEIRFQGLRYSDITEVNAIINSNGDLVIEEESGGTITVFVPLN